MNAITAESTMMWIEVRADPPPQCPDGCHCGQAADHPRAADGRAEQRTECQAELIRVWSAKTKERQNGYDDDDEADDVNDIVHGSTLVELVSATMNVANQRWFSGNLHDVF